MTLAGRAESVELFGFSQGELAGVREDFVDRLLAGELFLDHQSSLSRQDDLVRACAGSYPEALNRKAQRRRAGWLDNYVKRIVQRDAHDVSGLQRLAELPRLLRLVAARSATELNQAGLAADSDIPARTLPPYLDLLQTLYLLDRIPALVNSSLQASGRASQGRAPRFWTGGTAHGSGPGLDANPDAAGQLIAPTTRMVRGDAASSSFPR